MKTQEIKDLIASKIAGQGNQVDSGGALFTILDAIVDAVANATLPITEIEGQETSIEGLFKVNNNMRVALSKALFVKLNEEIWPRQDGLSFHLGEILEPVLDALTATLPSGESYSLSTIFATFGYCTIVNAKSFEEGLIIMCFAAFNSDAGEDEYYYFIKQA